ncbi:MAG: hypothetical protein ACI4QE_04770 [Acutalibacteraceae bacterium]
MVPPNFGKNALKNFNAVLRRAISCTELQGGNKTHYVSFQHLGNSL